MEENKLKEGMNKVTRVKLPEGQEFSVLVTKVKQYKSVPKCHEMTAAAGKIAAGKKASRCSLTFNRFHFDIC